MFGWWQNWRRQRLSAVPFPDHWRVLLRRNVGFYARLPIPSQLILEHRIRIFCHEKTWVGCGGLPITEEVKLTVAANALVPTLGFPVDWDYSRVRSVLLYPGAFSTPDPDDFEDDDFPDELADGMAWYRGPVLLNWPRVLEESRRGFGYNVVIHEFAHQLDFLDGETNGTPPLRTTVQEARWATLMSAALQRHREALDAGQVSFFTSHAARDEAEFFADASEAFFCSPVDLRADEPDVYALLAEYYRTDPTAWISA